MDEAMCQILVKNESVLMMSLITDFSENQETFSFKTL